MTVPKKIDDDAKAIVKRFSIKGLCDHMYICNTIAYENGMGNGCGEFNDADNEISYKTAEFIQHAYSSLIKPEDMEELFEILSTGTINPEKAKVGIKKQMQGFLNEMKYCDEWRVKYLQTCYDTAQATLLEFE